MPAIERYSPPTSYNIAALLRCEPGAWGPVLYGTLQRVLFIAPGLYLAGLRGRQLVKASALASASITASLIGYYWYFDRYANDATIVPQPVGPEALGGYVLRRRIYKRRAPARMAVW